MTVAKPTKELVALQNLSSSGTVFELHALPNAGEKLAREAVSAGDAKQVLDVVVINFLGFGLIGSERADQCHCVETDKSN